MQLWDVEVAIERGDVVVAQCQRRAEERRGAQGRARSQTGCTAIVAPRRANVMCGGRDGSLQLWEFRAAEFKPVILKTNAAPRWETKAEQVKPIDIARGAHS